MKARKPKRQRHVYPWASWSTRKLLDTRISDLGLRVEGSELEARIDQLYGELRERGFTFQPHFWLSDDWFCPDGVPGIALPFFLAHSRLKRLEESHLLEVEGGTPEWCMKLLRHETAHAVLNAYKVHRKRSWQHHFGKSSLKYPETYLPRPYSKRFVIHLENWYAQSHPHEDWAETFAVWLTPHYDWRNRYKDWPALKKLEYVDRLMQDIKVQHPPIRTRKLEYPLSKIRITLRQYYLEKQARYGTNSPAFYDRDLHRLFSNSQEHKKREKASHYIRRVRMEVIHIVSRWTGEYNYRINEVLKEMTKRCDQLNLHVATDDEAMKLQTVTCVTALVMRRLHSGGFHVSL
ncbi:MAG: hypothetical protein ACE5LB_13675 [Acidiferrobacterales bacterium]